MSVCVFTHVNPPLSRHKHTPPPCCCCCCCGRPARRTTLVHRALPSPPFTLSFHAVSLHSLSSPGEADLTDWSAFPSADMKSHGYYSQVMLSFIFNSAGKSGWWCVCVCVEGGGCEWWFGRGGEGRGDFKACFQNGIFSLNPHKEKTVITGSWLYFCLLRGALARPFPQYKLCVKMYVHGCGGV